MELYAYILQKVSMEVSYILHQEIVVSEYGI